MKKLREQIPARLEGDVWYASDMGEITALVREGVLLDTCDKLFGGLE